MDNETLDKVFNFVFGRYTKLHLFPDDLVNWRNGSCWPKFIVIGEKIGTGYGAVHELWVGPPELAARGLLTQLRVNVLGEDAAKLLGSTLGLMPSYQSSEVTKELLTTVSSVDSTTLRVKRYIAYGVIKLLEQQGGSLAIVEDYDVAHTILDVRSLEELIIKADLTA